VIEGEDLFPGELVVEAELLIKETCGDILVVGGDLKCTDT
jgi:hypothetical protein